MTKRDISWPVAWRCPQGPKEYDDRGHKRSRRSATTLERLFRGDGPTSGRRGVELVASRPQASRKARLMRRNDERGDRQTPWRRIGRGPQPIARGARGCERARRNRGGIGSEGHLRGSSVGGGSLHD